MVAVVLWSYPIALALTVVSARPDCDSPVPNYHRSLSVVMRGKGQQTVSFHRIGRFVFRDESLCSLANLD